MDAAQAAEEQAHAGRLTAGDAITQAQAVLNDKAATQAAKLKATADLSAATSALKTKTFNVQAIQTRKASIAGTQPPPKDIQDKIPEGQTATSPDGHTWQKKDGIVYFVK